MDRWRRLLFGRLGGRLIGRLLHGPRGVVAPLRRPAVAVPPRVGTSLGARPPGATLLDLLSARTVFGPGNDPSVNGREYARRGPPGDATRTGPAMGGAWTALKYPGQRAPEQDQGHDQCE
ncbi:MAG: hypothetical protein JSS68_09175 [Actinobacteria bacterium]|nr:hypothetical protein [Actinomycetota bacterium]